MRDSTDPFSVRQPSLTQMYVECRKKLQGQHNSYNELVACLFAHFVVRDLPYQVVERVWGPAYTGFLAGSQSQEVA